ncbi:uncharacterized protein V1516DRAFT_681146 [Lipomyces oligophaga]|uniref:uncharacterized protein n=1 Tax=Lipomyces oligophaga TaxID=45792 RepID=UPI0034CEDFB1
MTGPINTADISYATVCSSSSSPFTTAAAAAAARPPFFTVLQSVFIPQPGTRISRTVMMYLCLFLILTTLVAVGSYLTLKLVCHVIGTQIRNMSQARRSSVLSTYKPKDKNSKRPIIAGFFHPYCNAGGGGERVLWEAVHCTLAAYPQVICAVYTGDVDVTKSEIIANVSRRFEIELDETRVEFVFLTRRDLVSAARWPRVTLLGQAMGSIILAYEAIQQLVPDIFIDTMGYAFTYPIVSLLLGIPVAAYVHYPMISTDMLGKLSLNRQLPKFMYWCFFALLYGIAGSFADIVMANGVWTYRHIHSVWWINRLFSKIHDRSKKLDYVILYPPCATDELVRFDVSAPRRPVVLSIAQFRPEKRHEIIISEFAKYTETSNDTGLASLVLIGSVRDQRDRDRVAKLRNLVSSLGIESRVEFILDAKWDVVKEYLKTSSIGVNAMWNEHFGIGVVEYIAAGLIPIVHNSGGPKLDIVLPVDDQPIGFHFTTKDDELSYSESCQSLATCLDKALSLTSQEAIGYRTRSQLAADKFSTANFDSGWLERMQVLLMIEQYRYVERISR